MKPRGSFILLLALSLALAPRTAAAADPNPHNASKCLLCHGTLPRFGIDTRETVTFRGGKSSDDPALCAFCHAAEENLHPILVTPGPDMLYVATRSLGQGKAAGVASASGIAAGSLVHLAAAVTGLSALMAYSATAFMVTKYVGAVYLIYLAVRTVITGKETLDSPETEHLSLTRVFWQGALTNVLNPKVALFFLSFLPQFVDTGKGNTAGQIILLALLFNLTGTTVNVLVALTTSHLNGWIARHPLGWRIQRWITGSILAGLGVRLALTERD